MDLLTKPQFQNFHIEGVSHISPKEAFEAINNKSAVIVDVREIHETYSLYVPHDNVLYHPMSQILDRLIHLPSDKLLIVACTHGERSVKVANLFNIKGVQQVANLDGGLLNWKSQGLPLEENSTPFASSCGCGCSSQQPEKNQSAQSGCGCGDGCC